MRADSLVAKVHYQGTDDDFVVIAESVEAVQKWKGDKTVPLVDVVNSFQVFCTHKQGIQGQLDRASNAALENEFGTKNEDDVVKMILEKGDVQEAKAGGRQGERNPNNGPGAGAPGVHS
ncbi:putative RNA binding protein [Trichodelitschia bisporula]|uniref:Putative RNA binding protein n=1 Tax=Trichodelitschia bisporula TaxID=703511 RepID=A0A6G1I0A3_9PEZI|nr:putative RNA binding protein [Trichodelitschia bisporula]